MRPQTPDNASQASLSRPGARRLPGVSLLGAAAVCLSMLAGCIAGPAPSATATEAGPTLSDPSARSKTGTDTGGIPSCTRVWSTAAGDSVWNCPDPKPPAPAKARPG